MKLRLLLPAALLLLPACFPSNQNVTESGKGLPVASFDFPATVEPGSTNELTVEVSNPGPGDIDSLFVAFALVGVGGQQGNANPLVVPGRRDESPSITGIRPEPVAVGDGGTVYRFGPLDTDESTTISFDILAPSVEGSYANSLQVYDGADLERIEGLRLTTEVER